ANADGLVEVDNAIGPPEHGTGWTRRHTRRVLALVAARDLKRAARCRERTYVDVLDVRARDRERNLILALARRRARVTTDAKGLVYDFRPAHERARRHVGSFHRENLTRRRMFVKRNGY